MQRSTEATAILNYGDPAVQAFVRKALQGVSKRASPRVKLAALYSAVAQLPISYNANDDVTASEVLADGYGQCNTLATLLTALARSQGIPTRVHAYGLTKEAQRERMPPWLFVFAPPTTLFLWPAFHLDGNWLSLDRAVRGASCPGGACPLRRAGLGDTIRASWIVTDHGTFDSPDAVFEQELPTVYGWRMLGWRVIGRTALNRYVRAPACDISRDTHSRHG